MTQSLELLLDGALEAAVRRQWTELADAGLASLAQHTGESNRPHVTLLAGESFPAAAEARLAGVLAALPVPIRLGALICFGGRGGGRQVLARLVVPTVALLSLQAAAVALIDGSASALSPLLRPGCWTPHVTLALNLPVDDVSRAIAVLGESAELDGSAVAGRRWDSHARRTWVVAAPLSRG